jgi:hypothetical protein
MDEFRSKFVQIHAVMLLPLTGSRNGAQGDFDGGHKIKSVKIVSSKGKSTEVDAKFIITDTRMQVFFRKG